MDGIAAIISRVALVLTDAQVPRLPRCLPRSGTGIGVSISSAGEIRTAFIATFIALLVFSTARALRRLSPHSRRIARQD
jgi:hypothetical protein